MLKFRLVNSARTADGVVVLDADGLALAEIDASASGLEIQVVSERFKGSGTEKGPFTTSVVFEHGEGKGVKAPSVKILFEF